jgi:hypothetical protein
VPFSCGVRFIEGLHISPEEYFKKHIKTSRRYACSIMEINPQDFDEKNMKVVAKSGEKLIVSILHPSARL